jgi:hypothetical protein
MRSSSKEIGYPRVHQALALLIWHRKELLEPLVDHRIFARRG